MSAITTAFFAYPANPPEIRETIETAIKTINDIGIVKVEGWRQFPTTGKIIITEICDAIDESNLFLCDLTYLSPNVLFELGYAVAKNKCVWICLDTSLHSAKSNFRKLGILTELGYAQYNNSYELSNTFLNDQPFASLENTLIRKGLRNTNIVRSNRQPRLFYLKSEVHTESSRKLSERLENSDIDLIVDDPQEVSSQPLSWYVQSIFEAFAVVAHFIDEEREKNSKLLQNAKYAFVAGLAYGLTKPLLILAHAPYVPPVDFKSLLQVHETAKSCISLVDNWLPSITKNFTEQREKQVANLEELQPDLLLQAVNLGEYIAENEANDLPDYFLPTTAYLSALKTSQSLIYVGRKGSGKTANLFRIAAKLESDPRNHICVIKPVDYEFEGILLLFSSHISRVEQGYYVESLWKFLVYTELAISVLNQIQSRPTHYETSKDEEQFVNYVEMHKELILSDFAVRMDNAIQQMLNINPSANVGEQRARISEALHGAILAKLRLLLGGILEKKERVIILVDNLDKAWGKRDNLDALANFIFGLLNVSSAITNEFRKTGPAWKKVNLSILLFLRSDIYSFVRSAAREADKLVDTRIDWNDSQLLHRVIEERFVTSLDGNIAITEVWDRFFAPKVNNIPTKDLLITTIIPRPRDMIFLCKSAHASAVNRRHSRIEEIDIQKAIEEYSQHAFSSLVTETETQEKDMEAFLYEFAGATEVVTHEEVLLMAKNAGIPIDMLDSIIEILIDSTFLSPETAKNKFEFVYDQNRKKVILTMARRLSENEGLTRYKIHPAFHSFLSITRTPDS